MTIGIQIVEFYQMGGVSFGTDDALVVGSVGLMID